MEKREIMLDETYKGKGKRYIYVDTKEEAGTLKSSIGPAGNSTGIFRKAVTTRPLEEFNLVLVKK